MMVRKNEVRKTVRTVLASLATGELAPGQGADQPLRLPHLFTVNR